MKTEIKDISHGKDRDEWTYDHDCTLKVKRTDDNGNSSETEEYGYMIQGKDCIYLNAPKIYPSKDTPLLTDAPDIVGAINELFQDGAGGGDDWSPPEMPEPEDYEIYLLVDVISVSNADAAKLRINVASGDGNAYTGYGPIAVDWGDGTTDKWDKSPCSE